MTAFLFIAPGDARLGHRVDFANIGSLFTETDDAPPPYETKPTRRLGLLILILLGIIGDTLLIAHPHTLASGLDLARSHGVQMATTA